MKSKHWRLVLAMGLALAGCALGAIAAPPSPEGLLPRINDPFSAAAWRLGVDQAERVVAVGLANNSIALYSMVAAEDRQMVHLPIGREENQRAHPVALSPDGETLAYAVPPQRDDDGWPVIGTATVRILNRRDGRVVKTIDGLPSRAQEIRFSPDGRHLAAVLSSGCGVRVWRLPDAGLVAQDDEGYAGPQARADACTSTPGEQRDALPDTHSLAFTGDPDHWLVTSGMTGLRSYRRTADGMARVHHRTAAEVGLEVPDGIAPSPDGRWLAVGDRRLRQPEAAVHLRVALLALDSLRPAMPPLEIADADLQFPTMLDPSAQPGAEQFNLSRVAWLRADGDDWLLAAGVLPCIAARESLVRGPAGVRELCGSIWRLGGKEPPSFVPLGSDQIIDVAALPRRGGFLTLSNRRLTAFRPDGKALTVPTTTGLQAERDFRFDALAVDLRDRPGAASPNLDFRVSDDGSTVHIEDYGDATGRTARLSFDVGTLELTQPPQPPPALRAAVVDEGLTDARSTWVNQATPPRIAGKPIAGLPRGRDRYRALAGLPQGRIALVSANFIHIVGSRDGGIGVLCSLRIQSEGFRINSSRDGRLLVVGHGDGVLRWYRILPADGAAHCRLDNQLAVHLSRTADSGEWTWVAWRPDSGEFAAGGRTTNPLAWQIPDARCDTAVVRFNELTPELYNRTAVKQALVRQSDDSEVSAALLARVQGFCDRATLTVASPRAKARVTSPVVEFMLVVSDASATPRPLLVEHGGGTRLQKEAGERLYAEDLPMPLPNDGRVTVRVHLPERLLQPDTEFHVCFVLGVTRHCQPLVWGGAPPTQRLRRLWAVLIGVSDYGRPDEVANLRYARNDAVDLARLLVEDHRRALAAGRPPEYDTVAIDLFVTGADGGDSDLQDLAAHSAFSVQRPTSDAVQRALRRIAEVAGRSPDFEDLLLFHFSGHGMAHPWGRATGHSVLMLPSGPVAAEPAASLSSGDLITWLTGIQGDKLVVLDACRTLPAQTVGTPFDSAKVRGEFESALLTAYVMFSAHPGQPSRESDQHAFDHRRDSDHAGNGLFTYTLLRALTDRQADSRSSVKVVGKITVDEAREYIEQYFHDQAQRSVLFRQRPDFVPSRTGAHTVLRRLDDEH